MLGKIPPVVGNDRLIRVRVLCNLLLAELEDPEAEAFASQQFLEQLRGVGNRAAEELDQLAPERR